MMDSHAVPQTRSIETATKEVERALLLTPSGRVLQTSDEMSRF